DSTVLNPRRLLLLLDARQPPPGSGKELFAWHRSTSLLDRHEDPFRQTPHYRARQRGASRRVAGRFEYSLDPWRHRQRLGRGAARWLAGEDAAGNISQRNQPVVVAGRSPVRLRTELGRTWHRDLAAGRGRRLVP